MGNKSSSQSKPQTQTQTQCPSNQQMIKDMGKFGLNTSWLNNFMKWKYLPGKKASVPGQPVIDYDKMIAEMERLDQINVFQSNYNTAEDNLVKGPQNLGDAAYNLIDFRDGEQKYDSFMQDYLTKRVNEMVSILKAKFAKEMEDANYLNQVYETTWQNSRNTTDLFQEFKKENVSLERKINEDHSIISKNNRKSFYEDDKLVRMKSWNKIISWVYFTLLILYILFIAFFSAHSKKIKIILIVFFFTLPYFIPGLYIPFFLGFLSVVYHIYDYYIPKDIYMTLDKDRDEYDA
jgi:hypothetical protein